MSILKNMGASVAAGAVPEVEQAADRVIDHAGAGVEQVADRLIPEVQQAATQTIDHAMDRLESVIARLENIFGQGLVMVDSKKIVITIEAVAK